MDRYISSAFPILLIEKNVGYVPCIVFPV